MEKKPGEAVPASAGEVGAPGARMRFLRSKAGMKLSDLSELSGFPVSTLSKLETGKYAFTYDKLLKISQALGLQPGELLTRQEPTREEAPTGRRSLAKKGEGVPVKSGTYEYRHLAADILNKRFMPMIGEVHARSLEEYGELTGHPGEEFILVLEGVLELHTSMYAPVVMEVGDSIYFDSAMGHAYVARTTPCRILSVCYGSNE